VEPHFRFTHQNACGAAPRGAQRGVRPSFDLRVARSCPGVMGRCAGIDMCARSHPRRRQQRACAGRCRSLDGRPAHIPADATAPRCSAGHPPAARRALPRRRSAACPANC